MCKHIHLLCKYREQNRHNVEEFQKASALDKEDLPPADDESNILIKEVSDMNKKNSTKAVFEEKEKVKKYFGAIIDKISSPSKLEIVKKLIAPISPTLAAASTSSSLPIVEKIRHNTKITGQRRLFSTRKKRKARETFLKKPDNNETNKIAISLLKNAQTPNNK